MPRLDRRSLQLALWLTLLIPMNSQAGAYLGDLSWQQAAERIATDTVIIPFAAGAKEHGPHLPMNTDELVMRALLEAAVRERPVVAAPPILHGWFPAFRDYPGTEIAEPSVFQNYVRAVAQSLIKQGAQRIVFLNTGISRATGLPLSIVARDIRADLNVPTLVVSWDDLETAETDQFYEQERGGHADEGETSLMLYLHPQRVQMERAVKDYRHPPRQQIGYAPGAFSRDREAGVFGDPTLASAAKGEKIWQVMYNNWLTALDQFAENNNKGN